MKTERTGNTVCLVINDGKYWKCLPIFSFLSRVRRWRTEKRKNSWKAWVEGEENSFPFQEDGFCFKLSISLHTACDQRACGAQDDDDDEKVSPSLSLPRGFAFVHKRSREEKKNRIMMSHGFNFPLFSSFLWKPRINPEKIANFKHSKGPKNPSTKVSVAAKQKQAIKLPWKTETLSHVCQSMFILFPFFYIFLQTPPLWNTQPSPNQNKNEL